LGSLRHPRMKMKCPALRVPRRATPTASKLRRWRVSLLRAVSRDSRGPGRMDGRSRRRRAISALRGSAQTPCRAGAGSMIRVITILLALAMRPRLNSRCRRQASAMPFAIHKQGQCPCGYAQSGSCCWRCDGGDARRVQHLGDRLAGFSLPEPAACHFRYAPTQGERNRDQHRQFIRKAIRPSSRVAFSIRYPGADSLQGNQGVNPVFMLRLCEKHASPSPVQSS
jgi:hypothetical protein